MAKLIYLQKDAYASAGHAVRPHKHSCWELVYYMHSQGESRVYGKSDDLLDGEKTRYYARGSVQRTLGFTTHQLIIYGPDIVHDEVIASLPAENGEKQKVISIGFIPDPYMENALPTDVYDDRGLVVYHLLKDLQAEYRNQARYFEAALDHILSLILIRMARPLQTDKNGGDLRYVLQFIDEYFTTNLGVDNLARMANYSLSQFRKIFAERTGLSPKRYILKKRVDEAKYLLKNSALSLGEIAVQCGYEDYNQFQVFFKKESGVTPSAFRACP